MRSARLSSLVILAGVIVAGLVLESTEAPPAPRRDERGGAAAAFPTARPPSTLSSTWFCAGGTARDGGSADHVVLIANPTERDRAATVTVVTGEVAPAPVLPPEPVPGDTDAVTTTVPPTTTSSTTTVPKPPPVAKEVAVPAHSRVEVRLADITQAQLAGAIVEVDGGEVAVEHQVTGDLGRATAPCSTTASDSWSFPWGVTTRGQRELLVFMNPFPDDATVDISFATDEGVRDTARFQGFVVPGRSVVGAFIDQDITRRAQVSAQVQVRGGRIIVDRIQTFDGTDGREGITLGLGVPAPATTWMFPIGETGDGILEEVVVFNPTEEVAELVVEVHLDKVGEQGPPEPFELTVPAGRYSLIDLSGEERVPIGVGHSLTVRSTNRVPITAERVTSASDDAPHTGITAVSGSPVTATTWYLVGGGPTDARDEYIVVMNPSDEEATYSLTGFAGGQTIAIQDQQDKVIPPGARAVIRLGDHLERDELSITVTADTPVVVERGLYRIGGGGISQALGIPQG